MEELLSAERLFAVWDTVYGWLLTNVLVLDVAVQAANRRPDVAARRAVRQAIQALARALPRVSQRRPRRRHCRVAGVVGHLARAALARDGRRRARRATQRPLENRPHVAGRVDRDSSRLAARPQSRLGQTHYVGGLVARRAQHPRPARADDRRARQRRHFVRRDQTSRSMTSSDRRSSLAVLLFVAMYLTSLIESRIRTSQTLSPTVQVLFTKSLKTVLVSVAVFVRDHQLRHRSHGARGVRRLVRRWRWFRPAEDRQQFDQRRHPARRQVDQARRHHLGVRAPTAGSRRSAGATSPSSRATASST